MKIITGLILVVIVALVAGLVPLVPAPYYYETEVNMPLSYRITNEYATSNISLNLGVYVECFVSIENIDTVPGTFVVDFTVTTLNRTFTDDDRAYILPGEVKTLKGVADTDMGEDWGWGRHITPDTKAVTETITSQKRVTVFDYLLNY